MRISMRGRRAFLFSKMDARDYIFLLGVGLLSAGLGLYDYRVALTVVGVLFVGLSLIGAKHGAAK